MKKLLHNYNMPLIMNVILNTILYFSYNYYYKCPILLIPIVGICFILGVVLPCFLFIFIGDDKLIVFGKSVNSKHRKYFYTTKIKEAGRVKVVIYQRLLLYYSSVGECTDTSLNSKTISDKIINMVKDLDTKEDQEIKKLKETKYAVEELKNWKGDVNV